LRINTSGVPEFAKVFGKTFDVGPCAVFVQPGDFDIAPAKDQPDARSVRITLAQPPIYEFEKFRRETPNETPAGPIVE